MADFVLSCCSTVDLSKEYLQQRNISFISFSYTLDGVTYADDLGETMPLDDFYQAMQNGAETSTSQINAEEYADYFEPFLKEGWDVLHLCLSSGITGSVNSALVAQDELRSRYPDRRIYVVDSLAASSGSGLLLDKLADLRDEGKSIEEVYDFAEKNKRRVHHWFYSSDLTFYIKGGRVSKTAGFFGTLLNICPLLNVSADGKLIPRQNIRTKKKAQRALVDKMIEHAYEGQNYAGKCFMSQSACYDDARVVADMIEQSFLNMKERVQIYPIGTTIGAHSGPGTVAVFFWGDERVD